MTAGATTRTTGKGILEMNPFGVQAGRRRIPAVILTTSRADADILKSYGLHGNCCITKPVSTPGSRKAIISITFWAPRDNR
jgi:hypothetical protein